MLKKALKKKKKKKKKDIEKVTWKHQVQNINRQVWHYLFKQCPKIISIRKAKEFSFFIKLFYHKGRQGRAVTLGMCAWPFFPLSLASI